MELYNLHAYVPVDWNQSGNYRISPSGNCKILGATTNFSQETAERGLLDVELEHRDITLNGINMSYVYTETEDKKVYAYIFAHPNVEEKRYLIYTQDINTEAEDCMEFINQIDTRIVVNY